MTSLLLLLLQVQQLVWLPLLLVVLTTMSSLKVLQLDDRMDHRPDQLSGGQQQRVAIARALYNDPPIIVGDEPTGALDSKTGTIIMRLLRQLVTKQRKTVLIVTHDESATQYADRVIRLKDGVIIDDTQKAG